MLPYTTLNNYLLDDDKIEEYFEYFKKHSDNILYRDNNGTSHKITTIYGHDDYVKNSPELSEYKDKTLNVIAEKFLKDFDLVGLTYNCFLLITKEDSILQWHIDGSGSTGIKPSAAFMYDFRNTERAPTQFEYNGENYTLEGYKAALINTSTRHMVDNSGHGPRFNLRLSLYGQPFEYIRDKVNSNLQ